MRKLFFSELSCKETKLQSMAFAYHSWLRSEKGKSSKLFSKLEAQAQPSSSSIGSLVKVAEPPPVLPFFKPADYVDVLANIHEELETCPTADRPRLYLIQYQVFRGLGEPKLARRSLQSAWDTAASAAEKLVLRAWLKHEKRGEAAIADLMASCGKCCHELRQMDFTLEPPAEADALEAAKASYAEPAVVHFQVGGDTVSCDRHKIAELSAPLHIMLNGEFRESQQEVIEFSDNGVSAAGMRAVSKFSITGRLPPVPPEVGLELLDFANRFCCSALKGSCERRLAAFVYSRQDAIEFMECALELGCPILAAACLQVLLKDLPECLADEHVVRIFAASSKDHVSATIGSTAAFTLYSLLSEVAMNADPGSATTALLMERQLEFATDSRQRQLALHQLGCARLHRKELDQADRLFNSALGHGHLYSVVGLARSAVLRGNKHMALKLLDSAAASPWRPHGWMYQERALCSDGPAKWDNLNKATEADPTLTYPYLFRAVTLLKRQSVAAALAEITRILTFKLDLECLELRFCCHLALEDYQAALIDIQAILTLDPDYRMIGGSVAARQLRILVLENAERWSSADCWLQLYDRWSSVDDIGSLSVVCQMLDVDDAPKGVLYFRQSLLLLRLNCPEAAMRSLQLARRHAASKHERLVYEGWILYDTGHCEEGLRKAEESIAVQRSFEAFFLKAYALADSSLDSSTSALVASLLEEALRCPSDRLRKGQALNNLGSVYVDSGKLDLAAECYASALKLGHTRAHQGLARVHFLRNDRNAAYEEMTKLIDKSKNNASAYEKRSEYCHRELAKADLETVTKLDPLRVYPYRYRAAVLMDNYREKEAVAELTQAIAFKADLHLLHLRAAFHEHIGDVAAALRDCRAALSVDPNHQEMLELHSRVNSQEP